MDKEMKREATVKAIKGVQINGTFNVKRFFETLALILSNKEDLSITVTVHEGKSA